MPPSLQNYLLKEKPMRKLYYLSLLVLGLALTPGLSAADKLTVVKEETTTLGGQIKHLSNGKLAYAHLPILTKAVYAKLPTGKILVDDYIFDPPGSKYRFLIRFLIKKTYNPRKPKIAMRKNLILVETPVGGIVYMSAKGRQAYYPLRVVRSQAYRDLKPGEFLIDDFCQKTKSCLASKSVRLKKIANADSN